MSVEVRIAVFGGRHYQWATVVGAALDVMLERYGESLVIVHGGCNCGTGEPNKGADYLAEMWASCNGVRTEIYWALWKTHGKAAGPIRNAAMARSGLLGAIGFPGGRGTQDMARACAAAGVPVWWPHDRYARP